MTFFLSQNKLILSMVVLLLKLEVVNFLYIIVKLKI